MARVRSGQPRTAIYQQFRQVLLKSGGLIPQQSHEETSSCRGAGPGPGLAPDVPAPGSAVSPSQGTQARHSWGAGHAGLWWAGPSPRGPHPPYISRARRAAPAQGP